MPDRSITLNAQRTAGTATVLQWDGSTGLAIDNFGVTQTNAGGFYTTPLHLPDDCDVSRPIYVYQTLRNPLALITTGRNLAFTPVVSYLNPGEAIARLIFTMYWLTPDFWAAAARHELLLVSDATPTDPTIPGGTFKPGAIVGIRSYRESADPADDFPHAINMLAALRFKYFLRCQKCCCP